jgi:hypothetical protein
MWPGFRINVASGLVLLAADETTKLINCDFYVKLAFISLAVVFSSGCEKRLSGSDGGMIGSRERRTSGNRVPPVLGGGHRGGTFPFPAK